MAPGCPQRLQSGAQVLGGGEGVGAGGGEILVGVSVMDVLVGDGVGMVTKAEIPPGRDPWSPRPSSLLPRYSARPGRRSARSKLHA